MEKLLVSFSGGETSAYMLFWILKNWKDKYEIKIVFANTGDENEETLIFVQKCAKKFNCEIVWVEAKVDKRYKVGTKHNIVNFETASRNGEPFESVVAKYGIPNKGTPHCNRELKLRPIQSYLKSIGWKKYFTAIGIRIDEIDRINSKWKEQRLLYPLINEKPMNKIRINQWWSLQEFRLNLTGYNGNCKVCWKKSLNKLRKIAQESHKNFNVFKRLEKKYSNFIPKERLEIIKNKKEEPRYPIRFYLGHRSIEDIFLEAKTFKKAIKDDNKELNYQLDIFEQSESCDIFSNCEPE